MYDPIESNLIPPPWDFCIGRTQYGTFAQCWRDCTEEEIHQMGQLRIVIAVYDGSPDDLFWRLVEKLHEFQRVNRSK